MICDQLEKLNTHWKNKYDNENNNDCNEIHIRTHISHFVSEYPNYRLN